MGWDLFVDQERGEHHIVPLRDLVMHDNDEHCVCVPSLEIIERDGAADVHQYTHHSLDGREAEE